MVNIDDLKTKYYFDTGSKNNNACVNEWNWMDTPFKAIFSLYPKEWLVSESSNYPLKKYDFQQLRSIEPWWKLILSNKAILPLLWSMYPGHKLLLPAYYDDPALTIGYSEVIK